MDPKDPKARPERDRTDASLRAERKNTDQALAEQLVGIEQDADELLERARIDADDVLSVARERADRIEGGQPSKIIRARAAEDDLVRDERAAADELLREERDAEARALAQLLPLERNKTDRNLLTERARSDHALANRDDFLGIVSHDLRNLLSGIVLNTHVLAVTAPVREGDERSVAAVQRIQRYAARMNRLLGDLVDVVSIDAGRLNIQRTPADARTLLVEAMDTFAPSAAEKGIAIVSLLGDAPLEASFDHDRLMQVVVNLITNALKFTPTGGTITVLAEQRAEDLHICVSDTGCGIDSAFSEAVFERFWQIGVNDRRGMGLGLYISRCIVEAHGGTIWLVSELGKGSELHLAIPRGVT